MAKIHDLLYRRNVLNVLKCRIVTKNIHVEPGTFLDHGQSDPPGSNDRDGLSGYLVTEKWQIRMPEAPLVMACQVFRGPHLSRHRPKHKEGKLSRGFGQHVSRMSKWHLVLVGVGTIDIVKANRKLSHNFERTLSRFKNLGINLVPQRRNQPVDSRANFFKYQRL